MRVKIVEKISRERFWLITGGLISAKRINFGMYESVKKLEVETHGEGRKNDVGLVSSVWAFGPSLYQEKNLILERCIRVVDRGPHNTKGYEEKRVESWRSCARRRLSICQ
jgi:hypothetical protein